MAQAVTLARLHGQVQSVDWALATPHLRPLRRRRPGLDQALTRPDNPGAPMTRTRCSPAPPLGVASEATDEPSADRRGRRLAPRPAPTPHARRSTGPVGHRQGTTLGTGRSNEGTLAEELAGHQASSIRARLRSGRVPHRQDLRHLGRSRARSRRRPSGRYAPWSGSTASRTSSCADHQAQARRTSLKRSARPPSMPATR